MSKSSQWERAEKEIGRTSFIASRTGDSSDRDSRAAGGAFENAGPGMRVDKSLLFCLLDDCGRKSAGGQSGERRGEGSLRRDTRSLTDPNGFRNSHFPCELS